MQPRKKVELTDKTKDEELKVATINPEEDIREKIEFVVDTILKLHKSFMTVKEQVEALVDLGLNTYKMEPMHLRNLINEVSEKRGLKDRYLRKLLPDTLKNMSKTPLVHIHKKQLKESQTLQPSIQEDKPEAASINQDGTKEIPEPRLLIDNSKSRMEDTQSIALKANPDSTALEEELKKAREENSRLQDMLQPFIVKTFLEVKRAHYPIVATIDPLNKEISLQAKW